MSLGKICEHGSLARSCLICELQGENLKLRAVEIAAREFVAQIPCYVQGMSLLAEDDMNRLHNTLLLALEKL